MTAIARSYVTTAIPYVNARPHLGFALELCLADACARHRRQRGAAVRFATGTDDHSLKNVLAAERAGVLTAAWVERHARVFEELNGALGISADAFTRTSSSPTHAPAVRALWEACAAAGDLYRRPYRGLYCVGCERFVDEGCPEHREPPEPVEEENWFFRLSRHAPSVREAIEGGSLRVWHPGARAEALAFLAGPVQDISVSRAAVRARGWGIPVPGDPGQVIWVWFDALCHYLSALGYASAAPAAFEEHWLGAGERLHVLGKGISRFHAVYWPAFLASAGLPWPTDLLVHGYLTVGGEKISKSGRSVDPLELLARRGADPLRYWLLRHGRADRDGDFDEARFALAHDTELANALGNLASRVAGAAARIAGGAIPEAGAEREGAAELRVRALALPGEVDGAFARFAVDGALAAVFGVVDEANRFLAREAPWAAPPARGRAALRSALEALAAVAVELGPFLPGTSAALREQLGVPAGQARAGWNVLAAGWPLAPGKALFPRIER